MRTYCPLPPVIDDVTRRDLLRGAGALGAGWVLAACGPGADAAAPRAEAATRLVRDGVGEVEVPATPQRVALIYQNSALEVGLRHGVPIVGAGHSPLLDGGFPSWVDPADAAAIADIGWEEVDLEALAALRPDLIIGYPEEEINDRLAAIAPLARLAESSDDLAQSVEAWREMLLTSGEVLGVRPQVETDLAELDDRITELRERLDPALTVSAVRVSAQYGASVYPAGRLHAALLEELGVQRPPAQQFETGSAFEEFSDERIPELDADVVFVYGVDEAADNALALAELLQTNPLWSNLAAVRAGQVHVVPSEHWNEVTSISAARRLLDDFDARLVGAEKLT